MTLDEARLMAGVNARARRLFQDGYRARWTGTHTLAVRSPGDTVYAVDTLRQTCDCPFYLAHQGRHVCKHLLGWRTLLARQRSRRRLLAAALLQAWAELDDGLPAVYGPDGPLGVSPEELRGDGAEEPQGTEAAHADA